jgi:putative nucleotidyltransferase with HDIG domain
MNRFFKSKSIKKLIFVGAAIVLLMLIYLSYADCESKRIRTIKLPTPDGKWCDDGVSLDMSIPKGKSWSDRDNHMLTPQGAQYDFKLSNENGRKLDNWSVKIVLSETPILDSSWSGEYDIHGETMYFTPDGLTENMQPDSPATFGAVLYATQTLKLESAEITGQFKVDIFHSFLFYLLLTAFLLWLTAFGAALGAYAKVESVRRLRDRDALIIDQSITTFTNFLDAKDTYTKGHSIRVAIYAKEIARRYGIEDEELKTLYYATLLHDAGKMGIPDMILTKPGKLTPEEYEVIKTHTTIGCEMLKKFTAIPDISDGAHYHHERYDGKGYPEGLAGEDIPLMARIICVADSYDAMSSTRSYRKPYDNTRIINELTNNSGTQFDPQFVTIMTDMILDGFTDKIRSEYGAEEDLFSGEKKQ